MNKLSKWVLAAVVITNVFACGMVNFASANEWGDIPYIQGRYSRIYFDFVVVGNTGTFYCLNDWPNNREDGGMNGGLLSNEFNSFPFKMGNAEYEIRIYPDGHGEVWVNGSLMPDDPNALKSDFCWTNSPGMPELKHTIWEFALNVQGWKEITVFSACDPCGWVTAYKPDPPETPAIVTSGPSQFPHVIDGKFTDDSLPCVPVPTPSRDYQAPVRDPFFEEQDGGAGWTLEFDMQHGGVKVNTSKVSTYVEDVKWSHPPDVNKNNKNIINGWDEVSIIDSNSNCWNCPTQSHGDADCDVYVGPSDLAILLAALNTIRGEPNYNPCADFDRDGDVDTLDQNILLANWNGIPPADSPLDRPIVADDWVCVDNRPVTDIHWWGSFKGWRGSIPPNEMPIAFHLGIWTDVPDPNKSNPNNFSHPGRMVWENVCSSSTWSYAGYDVDPRGIEPREACFKFDQLLSQDKWFWQDSNQTIYWLSIAAIYDSNEPEPNHPWGWKTRPHYYNDDAVRIGDVNGSLWPPAIGSVWVSGEPIEYPAGTSWDMAFALTTNRKYIPLAGGASYVSVYEEPNLHPGPGPTPIDNNDIPIGFVDLNRDLRINFLDFAVMARYWLYAGQVWPEPNGP